MPFSHIMNEEDKTCVKELRNYVMEEKIEFVIGNSFHESIII